MRRIKKKTIRIIVNLCKRIKVSGFSIYEIVEEDVVSNLIEKELSNRIEKKEEE